MNVFPSDAETGWGADPMPEVDPTAFRGHPAAQRALRRGLLWFGGFILLLAVSMFLPAGRLDWVQGWVFLAAYTAMMVAAVAYLWRTNPEVVVARSTYRREGQTAAQRVIFTLVFVFFVAIFPVAAIDAGRFHWSNVPPWLTGAGYVLLAVGMAGSVWVLSVNKFAEPGVRIQADRGQRVVDTGPYALVRHPLYASSFFLFAGIPLALGSYWALVPAGVAALVIAMRTALEDRMLHDELAGYKEYASRVRFRLLPGIW
jgi:protein-S-isoprenylcysteine O-methyltransferase Ste14